MKIRELKQLLIQSWDLRTCSPGLRDKWNKENPSLGQCAITALIVNDFFGGKIMRCMASSGSHYYNIIDDELVDLTVEQFLGEIPQYENGEERTREYLLSNEDTKNRYEKLLYNLKQLIRQFQGKQFKLIDCNGQEYLSDIPGTLGGNKKLKIYGRLDCPSAKKWIEKGYYISNRVFFENEDIAIAAGYRPCAKCMPDKYKAWKNNQIRKNRFQMCVNQRKEKEVFNVELSRIQNQNVRRSTETILDMLPDYFYEIPASSSGKYHPSFSLGDGGLVRHVKVAMRILEEMFRDEAFGKYDDYTKDLIRMALILHDGFKSGMTNSGHTCSEHPVIMSKFILDNKDKLLISEEDAKFVSSLIITHMGPWNKDKAGNVIMPVPTTREELLVHLCDYIASRNFLNVYFENNEICDSVDREKVLTLNKK